MEYKSVHTTKEIQDDGRTVIGIPAVFGNIDEGGDRIFSGAFKKTIKERFKKGEIKFLWRHDIWEPPVATVKAVQEIKRDELPESIQTSYPEATGGLLVTREYLDTLRGNEILTGIKADPAAITQMSFGYDPIKFDFDDDDDGNRVRNLKEVKLWDLSDVNWGMNQATTASKSDVPYAKLLEAAFNKAKGNQEALLESVKHLHDRLTELLQPKETAEPLDKKALTETYNAIKARIDLAERAVINVVV